MNTHSFIIPIQHSSEYTTDIVGDKGVELGKLSQLDLVTPSGFILTKQVFEEVILNNYQKTFQQLLEQVDPRQPETITYLSRQIQSIIRSSKFPFEIANQIEHVYRELGNDRYVAIRYSQTDPQLPSVHSTKLNIQGDSNLLEAIKQVWADIFTPQAIRSYIHQHVDITQITPAILIQVMVQARVSGVVWTKNPKTQNKRTVTIQSVWGNGEYLQEHEEEADIYEIEKETLTLVTQSRHAQHHEMLRQRTDTQIIPVPEQQVFSPKLTKEEMKQITQLALYIHQKLFFPQRIEWSYENDTLYLLQTEQLTEENPLIEDTGEINLSQNKPLLYGQMVHSGLVSGAVKVCLTLHDFSLLKAGDIAVLRNWPGISAIQWLKTVQGIILDTHVSAREIQHLAVPCIANTQYGTYLLKNTQHVTLDAHNGMVLEGELFSGIHHSLLGQVTPKKTNSPIKIYLSTGQPSSVTNIPEHYYSGIGLMRAEYLLAEIGIHPKQLLRQHQMHRWTSHLSNSLSTLCNTVNNKPILYRFLDMTSKEFSELDNGKEYEPRETNPDLGYRGAFRYLTDLTTFNAELNIIAELREAGHKSIQVMFPFVRSIEEFLLLKNHINHVYPQLIQQLQLWMMVDTPATALTLKEFFKHGIHGVVIGSKDLLKLTTGYDADSPSAFSASYAYHPAYLETIRKIVDTAHAYKAPVIYAEHSVAQKMFEFLRSVKVDGVSVNSKQLQQLNEWIED